MFTCLLINIAYLLRYHNNSSILNLELQPCKQTYIGGIATLTMLVHVSKLAVTVAAHTAVSDTSIWILDAKYCI